MEEDVDYGWIIPLLFFLVFFVLPAVGAIRKAIRSMNEAMAKNPEAYSELMAARQAQLAGQSHPKPNQKAGPKGQPKAKPKGQLSTADQKRRAADRKRAQMAEQAQAESAPGRFTTQAEMIRNIERETASLEAGASLESGPSVEGAYNWEAQTSLESTAALVSTSLESDTSEGRSLLVDLEKAKAEDFADPVRSTAPSLAQRLRHPQALRDVLIAGEIFRRPD